MNSAIPTGTQHVLKPTQHCVLGYFQPELSKLAGKRVVGGCSWLIPLRSDWANEKKVALLNCCGANCTWSSSTCARCLLFWRALTYPRRPPSPEGTA